MPLKRWIVGLVLLAGSPGYASPAAAPPPGATEPRRLSSEFSIPERTVRQLHERDGMSYEEIRTSLILSKETGLAVDEIVALRKAGVPFETIASRHRLDLGEVLADYERERGARTPAREAREAVRSEPGRDRARRLAARHGVQASEVAELRRGGLDWPEVERALEAAASTGRTPAEVAELHRSGLAWREIERQERKTEAEERPLWDSPANPAAKERWDAQHDWSFPRQRKQFPPEQLDDRKERPSR